jgi:hypothetical protein
MCLTGSGRRPYGSDPPRHRGGHRSSPAAKAATVPLFECLTRQRRIHYASTQHRCSRRLSSCDPHLDNVQPLTDRPQRVASSAGPAQRGSVQFQVCGTGGHSLQRLNPVPFSECAPGGSANWIPITTFSVAAGTCPGIGAGSACVDWGAVLHPRTIGFRFKYVSQGSGVESGQSLPADFSWAP